MDVIIAQKCLLNWYFHYPWYHTVMSKISGLRKLIPQLSAKVTPTYIAVPCIPTLSKQHLFTHWLLHPRRMLAMISSRESVHWLWKILNGESVDRLLFWFTEIPCYTRRKLKMRNTLHKGSTALPCCQAVFYRNKITRLEICNTLMTPISSQNRVNVQGTLHCSFQILCLLKTS